jgi:hypothetical protein
MERKGFIGSLLGFLELKRIITVGCEDIGSIPPPTPPLREQHRLKPFSIYQGQNFTTPRSVAKAKRKAAKAARRINRRRAA